MTNSARIADAALRRVGIIGGTSQVGHVIIERLLAEGAAVMAFSRRKHPDMHTNLTWLRPSEGHSAQGIPEWISLAPGYALPDYLALMRRAGAKRLVMLSSTSLMTKRTSPRPEERLLAASLENAEAQARGWAEEAGAACTILRPTLVYGHGRDKNIAEIARFIRRFGFFPLLGAADGLRQPVHVEDVAASVLAALPLQEAGGRTYVLAGGEALTYRKMVERIFFALGRRPVFLSIPVTAFRLVIPMMRVLPRYRAWTPAMAERMNSDQSFSPDEAVAALGVDFRPFRPTARDVGPRDAGWMRDAHTGIERPAPSGALQQQSGDDER